MVTQAMIGAPLQGKAGEAERQSESEPSCFGTEK